MANTRALCLGCGRDGTYRTTAQSRPTSPSFFPVLSSNIPPGGDIYRGGFRLPSMRPTTPTFTKQHGIDNLQVKGIMAEEYSTADNYNNTNTNNTASLLLPFDDSLTNNNSILKSVSAGGQDVRPLYRKGFPGKKSMRAQVRLCTY